jgi:RNA polymerase sigma-70 factor (ECF subfamily)
MLALSLVPGPQLRGARDEDAAVKLEPNGPSRSERTPATSAASADPRDRALIERIAAHDRAALKELYLLYHRRLARFLTRVTSRYDLAEEIINDTHDIAAEGADSHEPWSGAEQREWLNAALERLPSEQRLVLELAYHLGHSCEEIAEIMNCPVNTVKTRMFHARRKLKVLLPALAGIEPEPGA